VTTSRDDDSGKFTEQYPRTAFIQAVASIENATTTEVAKEVGCSYDLAYRRLNALESEDEIERITVGSAFIWTSS